MLKRKRVELDQAQTALSIFSRIPIRFVDVDLEEALTLASRLEIYAYDAYLITCAQTQRSPLLTLDRGLVRAAKQVGVSIVEVTP